MRIINKRNILIAFLISFVLHSASIVFSDLFCSAPDELGTLSVAAFLSGHDWSAIVSNHHAYYGFGSSWFLAPLFLIVKDPIAIYRIARLFISLYLSLPTIISYVIMQRYYRIESGSLLFVGSIFCSFFSSIVADTFINEAMLVLLLWIEIYLILYLENTTNNKKRVFATFVLCFVMGYSLLVHTRAFITIVVICLIILFYRLKFGKNLVNSIAFLFFLSGMLLMAYFLNNKVQNTLFVSSTAIDVSGGVESIGTSYGDSYKVLQIYGCSTWFKGVLTVLFSNLFALIVFSCGLLIPIIIFACKQLYVTIVKKDFQYTTEENISQLFIPNLLCLCGMFGTLFAFSIMHVYHGVSIYNHVFNSDGRFFFYLRYYINFMPPLAMTLIFLIDKKKFDGLRNYVIALTSIAFLNGLFNVCFIIPLKNNGYNAFDVGMRFSAFTFWRAGDNFDFFCLNIIEKILLLMISILYYLVKKKKRTFILLVFLTFIIYEQAYSQFTFRKPIVDNYYNCLNSTYKYLVNNEDVNDLIDNVYVHSELVYKLECQVQLLFYDKNVYKYYGQELDENSILITNSNLNLESCIRLKLDENEFLYTPSEQIISIVKSNMIAVD